MTMTEADAINLCRLAEWLEKLALHGTESAGWPTYSKVLDHVSSIRAALAEVDRLKAERDALQWVACVAAITLDFMTNRDGSRPECIETIRMADEFRRLESDPSPSVIAAVRKAAGLEEAPQ